MIPFTVHGVPGSPYVRSVLLALEEKGTPWRIMALRPGEHRGEAHLRRHPFGRMPVFEHDGFSLYETQAILRYIDRILPEPKLTPRAPQAEARMNQICGITDCYVFKDISAGIAFCRLVAPVFGLPVDEARIAASIPGARICVAELENLLGGSEFMAGDALSIADLMLAPQIAFFADTPEGAEVMAAHPHLQAWLERMKVRPSMQATEWGAINARAAA